jgi:hypothetical protein
VKAPGREGLHEVVERVHLEGAHRVLAVRGHEDERGHPVGADALDDLEAAEAGHLDVEEDEVGGVLDDALDGRGAVFALAEELDVGPRAERQAEAVARERLVVDDEHAQGRRGAHGPAPPSAAAKGRWMETSAPPSGLCAMRNSASGP